MKTYEAIFNKNTVKGVYGISLVEDPAMQGMFIAMSADKLQLSVVSEEKRILAGLVLEPNKNIYRNQGGEEFNMFFSNETVKDLCYGFSKNNYNNNSTIEHKDKIEGVSFVENWLVRDEKVDTAVALGLNCKEGSWVSVMEIESDDIWENYVKTGKVQGFSVDAMLNLKEVNLKSEFKMKEEFKKFKEELLELFSVKLSNEKPKEEVKLGSAMLKGGEAQIEYTSEVPTAGDDAWVVNGEERVPLPVGDYELEDGSTVVVAEEGKIAEIKPVAQEDAPAEMSEEAPAPSMADDIKQLMKSLTIKYAEDTNLALSTQKEELTKVFEAQLSEVKEELEVLKKTPAAVALSSAPSQKSWNDMSTLEKRRYSRENG